MKILAALMVTLLVMLTAAGCEHASVADETSTGVTSADGEVALTTAAPTATTESGFQPPPLIGGNAVIPELNLDKLEIPDNAALRFVSDMKIGWNLGNTLDATNDNPGFDDELEYETIWCGVKTTPEMIKAVKAAGFNTLRLPVSWHNHVSGGDFTISKVWMDRVQKIVDYAISEGMYVILNIHHDIHVDYYWPDSAHYETSSKYMAAIWRQVAERFGSYSDHLVFEGVNEPRVPGSDHEWWLDMKQAECKDTVDCINRLNQVFVDTVRASGGNNAIRYLMVPGHAASANGALIKEFALPKDSADSRLIVSVHAYTPYNFALQGPNEEGSVDKFAALKKDSTRDIDDFMNKIWKKYTSQGIPVVIGEFGARAKNGNVQARVDFSAYYIAAARARGISCVWWDNNGFEGDGELFGLLDRSKVEWAQPEVVLALMKYSADK